MSSSTVSPMYVYRDLVLSMLNAFCGRLYPTLHLPPADLTGKTAVVTGANSGVGFQIALELVRQNATLYLACRNDSKAQAAVSQITSAVPEPVGRVKFLLIDTSSLTSVRKCAGEWKNAESKIDFLFHNAGIGSDTEQPFLTRRPSDHLRHKHARLVSADANPRAVSFKRGPHHFHFEHEQLHQRLRPHLLP